MAVRVAHMTLWSRFRESIGARQHASCPAVLMYHRVAAVDRDPWGLCVSPENFATQVERLRREREILPLDVFLRRGEEGRLSPRAVAITFDDGYRDNLTSAAPVLARMDAPATLFLATGPMRHQSAYWWDTVELAILDSEPVEGVLRIGSEDVAILLGPREPADDARSDWRAWQPPRTARECLYQRVWALLRALSPPAQAAAMTDLVALFRPRCEPLAGPMTDAEVRALIAGSPFTLGCHTVDHPDLSAVPVDVAYQQIMVGKADVEAIAGGRVTSFAYPYGSSSDAVEDLVRAAGFTHACTTCALAFGGKPPLALPRRTAQDRPTIEWLDD
jgi:peptidoglycan/xylan/chitin deacetylase (PgdA/CDA1 family)